METRRAFLVGFAFDEYSKPLERLEIRDTAYSLPLIGIPRNCQGPRYRWIGILEARGNACALTSTYPWRTKSMAVAAVRRCRNYMWCTFHRDNLSNRTWIVFVSTLTHTHTGDPSICSIDTREAEVTGTRRSSLISYEMLLVGEVGEEGTASYATGGPRGAFLLWIGGNWKVRDSS